MRSTEVKPIKKLMVANRGELLLLILLLWALEVRDNAWKMLSLHRFVVNEVIILYRYFLFPSFSVLLFSECRLVLA